MHTHRCITCKHPFACGGSLSRNHDGLPEIVCQVFDVDMHTSCPVCQQQDDDDNRLTDTGTAC